LLYRENWTVLSIIQAKRLENIKGEKNPEKLCENVKRKMKLLRSLKYAK